MSICYDIYLEGLVDGKWKALGPWCRTLAGFCLISPIMSGCSAVRAMLDCIECSWGPLEDLSGDVVGEITYYDSDGKEHKRDSWWFDYSALSRIDPARFEFEGYVPRQQVAEFERGDADCISDWVGPMEYAALPAAEKQGFTYYRWTEPGGTYDLRVKLKQRADMVRDMYCENWRGCREYSEPSDLRFVVVVS